MKDSPWVSRLVGLGEEAPDQLLAHPMNASIHPKAQQLALGAAIEEVGYVSPVIVNQATQHVLDGHLRVELAISRGEPTIPVLYVDLTPDEELMVLATLDPIGSMAVRDSEKLSALLADIHTDNADLQAMLDELGKGIGAGVAAHKAEEQPDDSVTCPACGFQWKLADGGDE